MIELLRSGPTPLTQMNSRLSKHSSQQGIALIVVLWMLVLLTIMAAAYSTTMRTETRLTAQQLHASQSRALAEAGIWLAVNDLLKPELNKVWPVNGASNEIEFKGGTIELIIQDQAGKIDLNTAHHELLQGLFESVDVEEPLRMEIIDALLDWRDRDDLRRLNGAEDPDYQQAGYDHEAKDGPFNSIDELRLVMGMTEEIYQKIYPALTIHSHLPGVNPDAAPEAVLLAIPGIDPDSIADYLLDRSDPAKATANPTVPGVNSRFTNRTKGVSFMITSESTVNNARAKLEVVISLRRTSELPYTVLSWREI